MKYVYSWYDTEDGEDCGEKIMYLTKRAFAAGSIMYPISALMMKPVTYRQFGIAYLYAVAPIVCMGAIFSATTCFLCKYAPIPKKASYALGGLSTGSVLAAATGSTKIGMTVGGYLGLAAVVARYGHEQGWIWLPEEKIECEAPLSLEVPDYTFQKRKELPLPSSLVSM